jgi:CDP-glucose 4,6-dehydratase
VGDVEMTHWQDRNVFVTGATGLVGYWLLPKLKRSGANVTILMRDQISNPQGVNVVHGSIEDYLLVERALNEYEIDTVFHLGAQTIVGTANRSPLSTFKSNVEGTWNILEACRKIDTVTRVVVASSDKAYGNGESLPYTEDMRLEGHNPYDVSKSCADLICRSYFETYELPVMITRCGNIYGGGDLNWSRLIPGTIKSILGNKVPIIRSDGKFIRDYIYVGDIVYAYMSLAESKLFGEAFNFSNDNPKSVNEVVTTILEKMNSNMKPMVLGHAENEIRDQYLSSNKARAWLKWEPQLSFEEGIKETIRWYKDYFESRGHSSGI